ncbi:MAG: polysaccharide biosynthesis protein [Burkholderiales bacterium]|nr:polysaccharide biosynthesis protein [Burkholderiales bacterium]
MSDDLRPDRDPVAATTPFWARFDALLTRLRPHREVVALALDALVVAICWHITYLFRLGFERWHSARPSYDFWVMLALVALYLAVFVILRVPKGMWRFSGFGEVQRLTVACAIAGLLGAVAVLMAQLVEVPRAVLGLHPVVCLMGLAMVRIAYRMVYEHMRARTSGKANDTHRALVFGAGHAARLLIAGIQHQGWTVVGLLDDDPAKQGVRVNNVPVLGKLDSASYWADLHGISHIVVAIPSAIGSARRRIFDQAAAPGLPVVTVPSADELREGRRPSQVRDIEPDDLLGREPVQLDEGGISESLSGKVVLITGAGGSIGSELCRQVARYGPRRLVLYELSEFALYAIEQELSLSHPHLPLVRLIGDVRDSAHIRATFERWQPQVVFHAAAYKHVPLMEEDNACAALRNNLIGTWRAAQAAAGTGVERFVLISTDKAVNPTNVMGATKRAAEMVVARQAAEVLASGGNTRFMAVRFGNVLGSSGSVIPKFKEQIDRGGPITVTHPEITRFFMTIPEAARLVLQAAAIGEGGQVFVLDMGEPVKIVDLARDMIRMSGHSLDEIAITFSGLRPGEKLYEELLADADSTLPTRFKRLRIASLDDRSKDVSQLIDWAVAHPVASDADVRHELAKLVIEYRPAGGK